jgi:hypothetical protein
MSGKYFSFLYATSVLSLSILGLYRAYPQVLQLDKFVFSPLYNIQKFGLILIFLYFRPRGFIMDFLV